MSMTTCKECGKSISNKAESCPSCGAKIKRTSLLTKIVLVLIVVGSIPVIFSAGSSSKPQNTKPEAATPISLRMSNVAATEDTIKSKLRNPDSLHWNRVLSNNDGTIVCLEARAQNGFGGMSLETYIRHDNKIETADAAGIKKYCGKADHDVTDNIFN